MTREEARLQARHQVTLNKIAAQKAQQRSTLILAGCVLIAIGSTHWFRLNCSPSVPYGLYRVAPVTQPLTRGAIVVLSVPDNVQHVWSRWLPLMKPVAALAGESVCNLEHTLWIDGDNYGPIFQTAHGVPLPQMVVVGCTTVPEGDVFLASHVSRSLDSRYFGPVAIVQLHAQAYPLLTWR